MCFEIALTSETKAGSCSGTELVLLQLNFCLSPAKCPCWCEAGMSHCLTAPGLYLAAAVVDLQCRDPFLQLALRVASPSRILCDARVRAFRRVGARAMAPSAYLPWQKVSFPKALEPRSQRASMPKRQPPLLPRRTQEQGPPQTRLRTCAL